MAVCDMCGNDYPHTFTITTDDGTSGVYDSFECAAHAMAPRCAHCGCTVLGHGVAVGDQVFCCSHCARETTGAQLTDSVG
ncbi:hypothetical protein LEP48_11590 [Isoptericola sp. NEAU-Y5]|uniref:Metallothionein n=1 Tax=Isoptericola luteus TaxID=2879484 RepID=A0ABS7ZG34_9MICO|nr:hypothetical protein [Isoptericola sp. NEAU-Y5]MCA5893984.1 hypothetical protein [Isoptericola sp. NEAU-Y5]